MLRFSDARNFARTSTGLLLIAGPLLLVIGTLVEPNTDHKNKTRELAAIAAHKGTYLLSGILFLLAMIALLFAAFGLVRFFQGSRGVTLGQVAGVLLAIGSMVGAGWYALGAVEYEMVNHNGLNTAALADFLHKADSPGALLPLMIMFLAGVVLGMILLGVAAIRTRVVPIWASVLLLLSGPLGFFSNGKAGEMVANVVLLVALGAIGVRALRMTDEEYAAPRERAKAPAVPEAAPVPAPAA